MDKKIILCLAHMSGAEQKYIQQAFDENWVVPLGPNVDGFEEDLKNFLGGGREVLAVSSGTAAVHLGLIGCGVGPGDEVIAQSFTFCASVNPIVYQGATPVLVDSERDTWNMDPDLLEEAIRERIRKTGRAPKAVIPVSLYGMPYHIDRILQIAGRYGIPVVEDSAEALGSRFDGQSLGTFGRFGVLSFNGNKMITTSGGGALICPDAETKEKMFRYATQSREPYPFYQHKQLGYNYRMSNISAGIGRGQMTVLKDHLAHHIMVARLYSELLNDMPGIKVHLSPAERIQSNYWLSVISLNPELHIKGQESIEPFAVDPGDAPNANVEALRRCLEARCVESRPLWKPMHLQPLYSNVPYYGGKVAENLFRTGLCLPSGPLVSKEDVHYICDIIKSSCKLS